MTTTTETGGIEPSGTEPAETAVADTEKAETGAQTDSGVEDRDAGADTTDAELDEDQDDDSGAGREAAKYRRRLRAAEAERDTLAATVEAMQRAEVERIATADELKPAALWGSGVELAGLLNDDGTVDAAKVNTAIAATRDALGIPEPVRTRYLRVPKEGLPPRRPGKPTGREAMAGIVMGRGVAGDG